MKVVVLGCGPAGLMAAQGVVEEDPTADVTILSKKVASTIGGAQYLHIPVPGVTQPAPDGYIFFDKQGLPENYAMRVYGDKNSATSWDDFEGGYHPIWDLRVAYKKLWELHQDNIYDVQVGPRDLPTLFKQALVISSIPLRHLCARNHIFTAQDVWISSGAGCNGMTIVYNGMALGRGYQEWYRESDIMGHRSREWSFDPDLHETVHAKKPLRSSCDCWPSLHKVGRFGKWQKGQLVSNAYEDAKEITRAISSQTPETHQSLSSNPCFPSG